MKVKFNEFGQVNEYLRQASSIESNLVFGQGKYKVDGKSHLGIYSLDLTKEIEVDIEERLDGETEKIVKMFDSMGILI